MNRVEKSDPAPETAGDGRSLGRLPRHVWFAVLLLLGTIVVVDVVSMRHLSVTYDEPRHFRYGQNIVSGDSTRFDDSKMPVSALNALPAALASRLPPGEFATRLARLETGRYVTVVFLLVLALCVFRWALELYGPGAGLLALALCTFDPNLLAHSQLVTTDVYAAGSIALALYAFWRFLRRGGWASGTVCGLVLGLAQLAKYTAIALFPLFVLIAIGFHFREIRSDVHQDRFGDLWARLRRFAGWAVLFVVLSVAVINAGFLGNRTGTPLKAYAFRSQVFRSAQAAVGWAGAMPVPVPYPYLEGLDWVLQRERTGEG